MKTKGVHPSIRGAGLGRGHRRLLSQKALICAVTFLAAVFGSTRGSWAQTNPVQKAAYPALTIRKQVVVSHATSTANDDPAVRGNWVAPIRLTSQATEGEEQGDVDSVFQQQRQVFTLGPRQAHSFSVVVSQPSILIVRIAVVGTSTIPRLTFSQGGKVVGSSLSLSLSPDRAETTTSTIAAAPAPFDVSLTNGALSSVQVNVFIVQAPEAQLRHQP